MDANRMSIEELICMNEKGYVVDINDGQASNIRKEKSDI